VNSTGSRFSLQYMVHDEKGEGNELEVSKGQRAMGFTGEIGRWSRWHLWGLTHPSICESWQILAASWHNHNQITDDITGIIHMYSSYMCYNHSWALALRPVPPASSFWHPASQSGIGAFRYRTWTLFRHRTGFGIWFFVHPGTGLTGCRTVLYSDI
jgi:hypothetical protein